MSILNVSKPSISAVVLLLFNLACAPFVGLPTNAESESAAAIVGRIVSADGSGKAYVAAAGECPEVRVSVNESPVSIEFDNDCAFVIGGIQPSPLVVVRVELVELGVAGTVEISGVVANELIEIIVQPGNGSLTVTVVRRAIPNPMDVLPQIIDGNNISIRLLAGLYEQGLIVDGNNFTLVGSAGENCGDQVGWTVITGDVLVEGNNATFRDIMFLGDVTLKGNNARFINVCFGGQLIVFGNNADFDDDDDDNDDDDNDDDDDDDDD